MADPVAASDPSPSSSQRTIRVREHDEDPSKDKASHNFHEYVVSFLPTKGGHDDGGGVAVGVSHLESNRRRRWRQAPVRVLQDLFLPIGYPASVNDGYLEYQVYDSIQGLSSYLRGVLCSASVLQAAGVGSTKATALSAAMTWALKDGVSMLGGLVFSYTTSPLFDSYVKEFRLFADLINDVGLALDMLAPYFSSLLLVSSLAGLCKALCGLSAGATKSSITCHFALEGNMADLNAKEATQETLVSLVGMLVGITLAHQLSKLQDGGNHHLVVQVQWTVFLSLTVLHVWANWKGVRLLRLRTLNLPRALAVLDRPSSSSSSSSSSLLSQLEELLSAGPNSGTSKVQQALSALPTPADVDESLLESAAGIVSNSLYEAACLTDILRVDPQVLSVFANERYVVVLRREEAVWTYPQRPACVRILVTLLKGATLDDQLKAFVHCLLLKRVAKSGRKGRYPVSTSEERRKLVQQTLVCLSVVFPVDATQGSMSLRSALAARGWEVHDRLYLGFPRRRSEYLSDRKKQE
jgi:Vitamin B6 photo-protection and homoeostasis